MTDAELATKLAALESKLNALQADYRKHAVTLHDHASRLEARLIEEINNACRNDGAMKPDEARAKITEVHRLQASREAERKQYFGGSS